MSTATSTRTTDRVSETAQREIEHQLLTILTRVRRTMAARARRIHPELHRSGYGILLHLASQDATRASDLVAALDLDKGLVSRQLAQLERLGLVERVSDPADRRAQRISLTPKGRQALNRSRSEAHAAFQRRLAGWTPEELVGFSEHLRRYNAGLGG